jgi:hypothetical protein
MVKPYKLYLTKHPAKEERKNKERGPKSTSKTQKPKVGHKGAKEQIMFQSFHQSQEAYQRSKRTET